MNIALLFSYTKQLLADLERERAERVDERQKWDEERKTLIDAIARAPVFNKPPPSKESRVPPTAFGPSAVDARQKEKKREQEEARANNGNSIDIPHIPE